MKKILTPALIALGLLANAQVMANSVTLIADSNYQGNIITFEAFDKGVPSNVGIGMIGPHPDQLVKEFDFKTTDLIDPVAKVEVRLAKYGANGSEKVFCSLNAYNFASQQTIINFTYPDQAERIPNGFVEGRCSG